MRRGLLVASLLLPVSLLGLGRSANATPQGADPRQSSGTATAVAQHTDKESSADGEDVPRVLQLGSPKPVPVPPFPRMAGARCDSSGNMYFRLAGAKHWGSILEISHDGNSSAAFAPPKPEKPDPLGTAGVRDFFVTPSGKIYDLLQNNSGQGIAVIEFNTDGSVQQTVKPEVPERLIAESLAVFNDGTLLLQGYIHVSPGNDEVKKYLALFDASGTLRKELTGLPDFSLAIRDKSLQDGGVATGQDGNVYLLGADHITVVSVAGEIARRIAYRKPDPSLIAQGLIVSDGLIAITVLQTAGGEIVPRYLVVRADDGGTVGYYTLPVEQHNPSGLCFSRNDGFTVLKLQVEEQKLTLVNAALR